MARDFDNFHRNDHLRFLDLISKSSEAAYNLLKNLLLWARSQRGKIEIDCKYFDLSNSVKECIDILNSQAAAKNIIIKSTIKENTNVYADYYTVNTVIRNILSNAIKFTKSGGSIFINSKLLGKEIQIDIEDSGIGMKKEEKEKLSRIDTDVNRIGTAGERGTGLGLVLCKEFIEKNKGKIWVESEDGKGSKFSFTLPLS